MSKPAPSQMLTARLMSTLLLTGMILLLFYAGQPQINKLLLYLQQKQEEPYTAALASGDLKRARALFDRDLQGKTGDPIAYLTIADICARQNHVDLAIEYLDRGLLACKDAPRPDRARLYGALSIYYGTIETAKPQQRAILAAQRASELDPSSPQWLNAFGYLLADNDLQLDEAVLRTSQALQLLKKGSGLGEDATLNCMVEDSYGWALYKKGNYDGAVAALNQAIADVPRETLLDAKKYGELLSELHFHLGAATRRLGKPEAARQSLQTALTYWPGNKEAKAELDDLMAHVPASKPGRVPSKPVADSATKSPSIGLTDAPEVRNNPVGHSSETRGTGAPAKMESPGGMSTKKPVAAPQTDVRKPSAAK